MKAATLADVRAAAWALWILTQGFKVERMADDDGTELLRMLRNAALFINTDPFQHATPLTPQPEAPKLQPPQPGDDHDRDFP